MGERVEFEPCFLLKSQPYRETSQLLEVFSAGHGRRGMVARGVRGPRSKLRGVLQPFRPLLLSWRGVGELATLTAAESTVPSAQIAGEHVFLGWYLNELLLRLLQRGDPHPELYVHYTHALQFIDTEGDIALRRFEKRLLEATGYGLQIPTDLDSQAAYHFEPETGLVTVDPAMPGAVSGAALLDLREERFERELTRLQIRSLLRTAIDQQLGGRPLRTRDLLLDVHRWWLSTRRQNVQAP